MIPFPAHHHHQETSVKCGSMETKNLDNSFFTKKFFTTKFTKEHKELVIDSSEGTSLTKALKVRPLTAMGATHGIEGS
jgi:hypothetical protein